MAINAERLLKLADYLETVPKGEFKFVRDHAGATP